MDHMPQSRDITEFYIWKYGNGNESYGALRMLKETERCTSKEEYVDFYRKLIREYNQAVDNGEYIPKKRDDGYNELCKAIGYDDLYFAR